MKLHEFRLLDYDERSMLQDALSMYKPRLEAFAKANKAHAFDKNRLARCEALLLRLSQTECQPGGCEYCNADRARAAESYYDE